MMNIDDLTFMQTTSKLVNEMFYLKVPADQMLPLMYLIDSICKNHGSPYKEMFNHNLVSNFAYIFQQVSEKVSFLSNFLTTLKSWFQPEIPFFLPSILWSLTNTNL